VYPWHRKRFVFYFLLFALPPVHTPLFNSHLASRSTPTKAKKVRVSESLALLRAYGGDASYACLLFPPNQKTRLHVADRFKFFISQEVTTGIVNPSCSCYKSGHASARLFPIRLHGIQSSLQFIRRQCLLLPTRFFPGRPRTPVRASCLAHGALSIDSRRVLTAFHVVISISYVVTAFTDNAPLIFTSLLRLVQTDTGSGGQNVTSLWRAIRPTKEERVAKLEWAANGGLGRATIGKVSYYFHNHCIWNRLFTHVSIVCRR